jgi:HSP20 family molecular chaperone IbpA/Icc-related predicted phosphoesterase
MSQQLRRLLVIVEIRGEVEMFARLLEKVSVENADAVVLIGDLGKPWHRPALPRAILRALGESGRPAFWVPGRWDGPLRDYLPEPSSMEPAFPMLHALHGTAVFGPGDVVFAGMGGAINDDPSAIPSEEILITYPGWEVERRFKVLRTLDAQQQVFLFATSPAHKGLHTSGSEVLATLIKTYRPQLVVVAGEHQAQVQLGKTLVLCPGLGEIGSYALVDFPKMAVCARRLIAVREEESLLAKAMGEAEAASSESLPERLASRLKRVLGPSAPSGEQTDVWSPHIERDERDDAYVLEVALPGIEREAIDLELAGNELTISGDVGPGRRLDGRVAFPEPVDADAVEAKLVASTLRITAPKSGPPQHETRVAAR